MVSVFKDNRHTLNTMVTVKVRGILLFYDFLFKWKFLT